ncbi:MAG: hydroxymethylbilane synthase [Deltaproteobacteria bacterium]|nr:hydroxymethylbilane synthase [Deltaproteobacteria bacterium]
MKIRIGTRGSDLALWQADYVAERLGRRQTEIIIIRTQGDSIQNISFEKMEGKGFFTKEIENALLEKSIDLAVHSLKDLPTDSPPGLCIAAIPVREEPSDVLLIRPEALDAGRILHLRENAIVGTSSVRRLAQIKHADPTLKVQPLRGNVTTRLRKLREGSYDAIMLAHAGIARLELDISAFHMYILPFDIFLPAPAQGALGLQVRTDDEQTRSVIRKLNHEDTELAVTAEREFLKHFGGGCHIPLGALATIEAGCIHLTGIIAATDGSKTMRQSVSGSDPKKIGAELARILKAQGAAELL